MRSRWQFLQYHICFRSWDKEAWFHKINESKSVTHEEDWRISNRALLACPIFKDIFFPLVSSSTPFHKSFVKKGNRDLSRTRQLS